MYSGIDPAGPPHLNGGQSDVPRRLLTSGTAAARAEASQALGAAGDVGPASPRWPTATRWCG
ncbi:MAG TPA: hypothetical protein VGH89_05345 [Pseudonocardia sp.]|jgi:hypothetical protein